MTRSEFKTFLWGILVISFPIWVGFHTIDNPLNELGLILHSQIANGVLEETYEDEQVDERDRVFYFDIGIYHFNTPDGKTFKAVNKASTGELDKLCDVEYLSTNPTINRIKGSGSKTIIEWFFQKILSGGFLLILFLSPGICILHQLFEDRKKRQNGNKLQS